ncbi:MAG: threonine--tRNA ligase [Liquorilactobacillus nagelii]|jgi:threonyl-tRNA synthetase|uniref:Threonine--tRNA ligase n=1 Tax=Liquorilactobacillus nagelii TaxID=82688 RepID=A0A3S6R1H5_9LACO|nr:threonine--tRNA ligase [Liquorilactobacillus nagelii]AUJ32417.1 threonine--tRNA ligase [Liquorilactobacillus nagelii]KRL40011.1 threonyl-tRNA synthetase [Liquorilactobacillus nagelii DSM 13675]MCC7615605.1 threonine--tRNA ligase [Liquorilactobacillus nagelii]MCI1699288.1 threonine--tRNA ligase [Liquorilactobacillus nagelii]MCP9314523.1 threonine--tRNA ligase [Liquorilactobacillus nagelii]
MSNIEIEFPDGAKKEFATATTVREVAATISNSLAKKAVGANFAGKVVGLNHQLKSDGKLAILTKDQPEALPILWQTGAVVLGAALQELYPEMYFGESDITEHGFFLDTDNQSGQVAETEFEKLNQHLQKLVKQALPLEEVELDLQAALKIVGNDPYRQELINEQATDDQKVTAIKLGDYYDFSVRAVLGNTAALKVFKLLSVAGAYWKGASSNPMLQRIYGTAFFKQKDLDAELARQKEAHERDHRVIGNELDLFFVDPKVGAGLPYWMPKGATIRRTIERYIIDKEVADGYQHVYTPVLANLDLYKQSGHWDHYREDMFPPMDMGDGEMLELRPMNCPSHIQIYNHHIRSYRELPLRIAELGMMHRYEKSGALTGLSRVREMTLNDGHTFVALDQIEAEFKKILQLMVGVYADFDITDYRFRLSYRDPANKRKYFDDDEMWEKSQKMLKSAMDDLGLEYFEAEGEAAFYGPKLDVQTKTALGGEETLSTIQLDFLLPERFDLHYIGADGQEHRPVMIHRGIVSTMERFTAYLTEIYKGAFPTWLAPQQVAIIPVNNDLHLDFSQKLRDQLVAKHVRVQIDDRNEKMGYKIRQAQVNKIPYTLVVGDKEIAADQVTVRKYGEEATNTMAVTDFIKEISADVASYSRENN